MKKTTYIDEQGRECSGMVDTIIDLCEPYTNIPDELIKKIAIAMHEHGRTCMVHSYVQTYSMTTNEEKKKFLDEFQSYSKKRIEELGGKPKNDIIMAL